MLESGKLDAATLNAATALLDDPSYWDEDAAHSDCLRPAVQVVAAFEQRGRRPAEPVAERRSKGTYFPFGLGPQNCISDRFATTEPPWPLRRLPPNPALRPAGTGQPHPRTHHATDRAHRPHHSAATNYRSSRAIG